jgi:hypothetical protein
MYQQLNELQKQIEQLDAMLKKEAEYRKDIRILGKRNSYSKTDKDATFMRMKDDHMKNGQLKPGYNLQLGIEAEYIVGVDVSSDLNDTHALPPLLERMEEKGGIKHQDITTDAGYESEETYAKVKARGQVAYIKPLNYEKSKKRSFRKNAFLRENMPYDAERDCFICPAKQELTFQGTRTRYSKSGYAQEVSVYKAKSCVDCPHKGFYIGFMLYYGGCCFFLIATAPCLLDSLRKYCAIRRHIWRCLFRHLRLADFSIYRQ